MKNKVSLAVEVLALVAVTGCAMHSEVPEPAEKTLPVPVEVSEPAKIPVISIQTESEDMPAPVEEEIVYPPGYCEDIAFDSSWEYADHSVINSGEAKLYRASDNRRNLIIGVNAGHGTKGGQSVKTYCHPDKSPKVTGGSTPSGSLKAPAVTGGMTFADGTKEAAVTLRMAQLLKDALLEEGFDVLMIRDDEDVQLDNVARTVMCNNVADCMISLHWDGDGLSYDKGCFYISAPEKVKDMEPVASHWQEHETLGQALIDALAGHGYKISGSGHMAIDLTQMSYSTVPSVDIELGNAASAHDDATLSDMASALTTGVSEFIRGK